MQDEIFNEDEVQVMKEQSDVPKSLQRIPNKRHKCYDCGEKIDMDDDDYCYTLKGELCCPGCREHKEVHASTLCQFSLEWGNETYKLDSDLGDIYNGGDLPEPIKEIKWVSTSAWRGYTDWTLCDGFVIVSEGWVTSDWDDRHLRKKDLADIFEDLRNPQHDDIRCPITIYWMFGETSNVFSTSSSIIIHKDSIGEFSEWLSLRYGYDEKDLENMFS